MMEQRTARVNVSKETIQIWPGTDFDSSSPAMTPTAAFQLRVSPWLA